MFHKQPLYTNILGWILTILGALILFIALGDFLFRLAIAILGVYLIYSGFKMRNQHQQILFYFHRFGNRFGKF